MITTVNNNQRVFQVIDAHSRNYFCNLNQLNEVILTNDLEQGTFKINHFWNGKFKRVTKDYLKQFFEANGVEQQFKY